jgi:hypothetical protein
MPKIDWTFVFMIVIVGIFTRSVFLTYFEEHFTNPSAQVRTKSCPDGTRTTNGQCLLE